MRWKSLVLSVSAVLATSVALLCGTCSATKERVLYAFKGGTDGQTPIGALVADGKGNLYGTTESGGVYGVGTVFKLTRSGNTWKESVLHTFGKGNDGAGPTGKLMLDDSGTLYGTTSIGGGSMATCTEGCGTVFSLAQDSQQKWTERVLHRFNTFQGDGAIPYAGLLKDRGGNFYGATAYGGTGTCNGGCGTVFELKESNGVWEERVIYSFNDKDGRYASNDLTLDSQGNLYGATAEGGATYGVVFKLLPSSEGQWSESILHTFTYYDGAYPSSALIFDHADNLYGVTGSGSGGSCGCCGCGVVFRLTPQSRGIWAETVLYNFAAHGDGISPDSLILSKAGRFYGAASGSKRRIGFVFELGQESEDRWQERVLHTFWWSKYGGGRRNGDYPGGLIFGPGGSIYGVGAAGGDQHCGGGQGCGVVFQILP